MKLTRKERAILSYLQADEAGATCAEIGLALLPAGRSGRREWAGRTLNNLCSKGLVYPFGIAVGDSSRANIWHIFETGRLALDQDRQNGRGR